MALIHLIASSDDYLLEEKLRDVISTVSTEMGGVEPEVLPPETLPETLAVELCSPSLFAPQRVLVAPEVRTWVGAAVPRGAEKGRGKEEEVDVDPLVQVLEEGLSSDIGLVMGAWCGGKPQGPLVAAVESAGVFDWGSLPEPPKPWEDATVSEDQERVLRGVLKRAVGEVRFSEPALRLLLDRLGFAPRLLVQEGRKLAAAAKEDAVDEELVRALCFPKERSLDVVRDAVLDRKLSPILDILNAAENGVAVRDWQGGAVDPKGLPLILANQTSSLFQQLLYLRCLAADNNLMHEMDSRRTSSRGWYSSRFKSGIAPELLGHLDADKPSPVLRPGARKPTVWALSHLFQGAARYTDSELVEGVADLGGVEAGLRRGMSTETLSVWFAGILG